MQTIASTSPRHARRCAAFLIAAALLAAGCSAGEPAAADEADGPASLADDDPRSGRSEHLFDQTKLHTFDLTLSPEDLATLENDPIAEEYVEADLSFEGETFGVVGVRHKGSIGGYAGCVEGGDLLEPSGAKICTKLSMKLKVNWQDSKTEFFGQRKIQLHSQNLDDSMMHERLGYWLFREMGVPAPRSTHARVTINGDYIGLFALTEAIDGRFTRANYDDGAGNLYKEVWPFWSDFTATSDWALRDGLRTNERAATRFDIITGFAAELLAAPEAERADVLARWTDVDELLKYAVVDRAIAHDDGPMHWYCSEDGCGNQNFYWYENPTTRTVHLIPWDLDGAFRNHTDPSPYTEIADGWGDTTADCATFAFGPLERLQRSAACDPLIGTLAEFEAEFAAIKAQFLAGPFSAESVEAHLAQWVEQIRPAVQEAAELHSDAVTMQEWFAALEVLRLDLAAARAS